MGVGLVCGSLVQLWSTKWNWKGRRGKSTRDEIVLWNYILDSSLIPRMANVMLFIFHVLAG